MVVQVLKNRLPTSPSRRGCRQTLRRLRCASVVFCCIGLFALAGVRAEPVFAEVTVMQAPPAVVADGSGPFTWQLESTGSGGYFGGFAYFNPATGQWVNCAESATITYANLSPGLHEFSIATSYSPSWASSHGLGIPSVCYGSSTPTSFSRTFSIVVDTVPPEFLSASYTSGETVAGFKVFAIDMATDSVRYEFEFGDGTSGNSSTGVLAHQYPAYGTYLATVTAIDGVGNAASTQIQVTLTNPRPAIPPQPAGASPTLPSSAVPQVRSAARLRGREVRTKVGCPKRRCALKLRLRIGGYRKTLTYNVPGRPGDNSTFTVRLAVPKATLKRVAAGKRRGNQLTIEATIS